MQWGDDCCDIETPRNEWLPFLSSLGKGPGDGVLMRITKISVKGLFGMFDHEIPLNQESRITIVHGPNGVGKTVFLRLVHALFSCNYDYVLDEVPFDEIRIDFETDTFIFVQKQCRTNDTGYEYCDALEFRFYNGNAADGEFALSRPELYEGSQTEEIREFHIEGLADLQNWFQRIETGEFALWRKSNWLFTSEQLVDMVPGLHDTIYGEMPQWFADIRSKAKMRFITADRTQILDASGWIDDGGSLKEARERGGLGQRSAVSVISDNIKAIAIGEPVVTDRDKLLASLARVDPIREDPVLATYLESPDWRVDYAKYLAKRRSHYRSYYPDMWRSERALYEDVINERFLFKTFKIDAEIGLSFRAADGKSVHCDELSSGEQQLLNLYYQLLFEVDRDTLVMIDEPELSMHVDWQEQFLKDMQRIVDLRKVDLLISTHSPTLVDDKWEWMVGLSYPEKD